MVRRSEPPHRHSAAESRAGAVSDEQGGHGDIGHRGHAKDQYIQNAVEDGQGQNMAGKHGAAHGEGEKEHPHKHLGHQPAEHPAGAEDPQPHLGQQGQQAHHGAGQQVEAEGGDIVGDKKSLPPDGQGVIHGHRAGVHQIGEQGHGDKAPKDQRQGDTYPGGGVKDVGHQRSQLVRPRRHVKQLNGQRKELDGAVKSPDGPEPGHVFPKEGGVEPALTG